MSLFKITFKKILGKHMFLASTSVALDTGKWEKYMLRNYKLAGTHASYTKWYAVLDG